MFLVIFWRRFYQWFEKVIKKVIPSTALTSDDLDTQMTPVQFLLFVAALFIYGTKFYTCSWSCTSFHYDISAHLKFFFIENCPKLRAGIPNFGHTLICCYRPKLRFCRVTSDTKTCFKKPYKPFWANTYNLVDLVCIPGIWRSKVENSLINRIETSFLEGLANHPNKASNEGWRHLVIN